MVYLFLADGFEEIEALTPLDLLRRADVQVQTVGVRGKTVMGAHGIPVTADITADEAHAQLVGGADIEMVILPGGMPGSLNLDAAPVVDEFLRAADAQAGYMAAICAAPLVLGRRGYLRGRKAVCYPGFENELVGAEIGTDKVVCDGRIITGQAMGAALPFALALIAAMKGEGTAEKIRASVLA